MTELAFDRRRRYRECRRRGAMVVPAEVDGGMLEMLVESCCIEAAYTAHRHGSGGALFPASR